jgi:hypothetical protein
VGGMKRAIKQSVLLSVRWIKMKLLNFEINPRLWIMSGTITNANIDILAFLFFFEEINVFKKAVET